MSEKDQYYFICNCGNKIKYEGKVEHGRTKHYECNKCNAMLLVTCRYYPEFMAKVVNNPYEIDDEKT